MNVSSDRLAELTAALAAMRVRLARAAEAAGRSVEDVKLLPVTKFFPASDVAILWRLGCRGFGESRSQEAVAKIADFRTLVEPAAEDRPVNWHMVGRLQRNKAKNVAAWADTVHSVSTAKVVKALDAAVGEALSEGRRTQPMQAFVQISLDGDTERGGVDIGDPGEVDRICDLVGGAGSLVLVGLMAVAPVGADPDVAFAALAEERRRVLRNHPGATELSAGMSQDLEAAVRHGSTCVRVGTALMGKRPLTSP